MVLRDKGRCSFEKYGRRCNRRRFLNIHHIKPVKDGGQNTVDNLATLCETHHIYLHHKEE
ncbi:MAG: HNH endonuclease, partial [Candidatus Cloacimonetes bacterium]|nr:HNH endonuclease [Candidatus Cloacimonadota bacterium]